MKLFYALTILIIFQSCSFDNKSGIWKNANETSEKNDGVFKEFEKLSSSNETFDKIVLIKKNFKFKLDNITNNYVWNDIFYNSTNNFKNYKYNNSNQLLYKSKKLTKNQINNYLLFDQNNIILNDEKGNILVFSINEKKIITKFNFYKKKYKKIKKDLNLIVDKGIIYVSDNIGFLYAYDYKKQKLVWAQNHKIPFRSNLKISPDKLIAANQNNNLIFFNKFNGEIIKMIPTEETSVKNEFKNNISLKDKNSFFLNTYGSLYSIDNKNMKINWFVNLNRSLNLNPSNLFRGNQVILHKNFVLVNSNQSTYLIDVNTGSILFKKNFTSHIKPLVFNNYLFLISKTNLLISIDLKNGDIIYSYHIDKKIANFLKIKKRKVKFNQFKEIMMINNKLFIFLKNSYILKFDIYGNLENIDKLPSKIKSQPIFIDSSLLYLDVKNKLSIID